MEITFWGARGSIPVSGKQYNKFGGNTTCVEIRLLDGKIIAIDAGTGIRLLGDQLLKKKIYDLEMFITHFHWDHLQGFPFMKQIYSNKMHIRIHTPPEKSKDLEKAFKVLMNKHYHPIPFSDLSSRIEFVHADSDIIKVGKAKIERIRNNHPGICYSLKITENNKTFVFITDNELFQKRPVTSFKKFTSFCNGADLLVHDSMFKDSEIDKRRGWGHSSVGEVIKLASEAKVKRLGLFHHDPDRTDKEVDKMVADCQKNIGKEIKVFGVRERQICKL